MLCHHSTQHRPMPTLQVSKKSPQTSPPPTAGVLPQSQVHDAPGPFGRPINRPAESGEAGVFAEAASHHLGALMPQSPGRQRPPRQPRKRFPSQHLLPRPQQPGVGGGGVSSRPSQLSSIHLRVLLGQMANATVFRLLSYAVFCWVTVLSPQVHTDLSV